MKNDSSRLIKQLTMLSVFHCHRCRHIGGRAMKTRCYFNEIILLGLLSLLLAICMGNTLLAEAAVDSDYAPVVGTKWAYTRPSGIGSYNIIQTVTFESSTYQYWGDTYLDFTVSSEDGYAYYNGKAFELWFGWSGSQFTKVYLFDKNDYTARGMVKGWYIDYGASALFPFSGERRNPLVANFSACPLTGDAPLTVQFSDTSEGLVSSRTWSFGDGATSTEKNPVYTYTAPGTYKVSLTVSNDDTTNTLDKPNFINATNNSGNTAYICDSSVEKYRFGRLWPSLQQPWYFSSPRALAIDKTGNIYVADAWNHRIQKFTANGQFITSWGRQGNDEGEFNEPSGLALDRNNNIYVVDRNNNRIQKFTADGRFLKKWGTKGNGNDQLDDPRGIVIDGSGDIFVTDKSNNRVQKFTADGHYITTFGTSGTGNGQFTAPIGIDVDGQGNLFVSDAGNYRIQRFTPVPDGSGGYNYVYSGQWGTKGTGNGQFESPAGIAFDSAGNMYVADYGQRIDIADPQNHRIQKFAPVDAGDGRYNYVYAGQWGSFGYADGQFASPVAISIDRDDNLYVGEYWGHRIQKFTPDGLFITRWASWYLDKGMLHGAYGAARDKDGNIYVADSENHRIQKFSSEGRFITAWGGKGSANGQFNTPWGVAVDGNGNVYAADSKNHRIQKFTSSNGQTYVYAGQWGNFGSNNGQFKEPRDIATDSSGNVHVADTGNDRIQKFSPAGVFLTKWGGYGLADGLFDKPHGVTIDSAGNVYVADTENDRIQKFRPVDNGSGGFDYVFVKKWGTYGSGEGQFDRPYKIDVDHFGFDGAVYVSDPYNERVQKFTSDGQFITQWGGKGTNPGQFRFPTGLAVGPNGNVYVVEYFNNRVQLFKKVTDAINNKAIILAGGGPYRGNYLWDATRANANFAYRTLTYQGFTKNTIYYLTPETALDLDGNGLADDVDGEATIANLQSGITTWAKDATNLIVYLVDHGGNGSFRVSEKETLSADDLKGWIDSLQATIPGKVVVIYDACESGSFLPSLVPPANKERIVISSALSTESAYFVSQGAISFSNYFWTNIFKGSNIRDAFNDAKNAISAAVGRQTPLLDDNGNGVGNEVQDGTLAANTSIGNGTVIEEDTPVIGSVSAQPIDGTDSVQLSADNVTDAGGIARVWALITPPGYNPATSDNTVHELPSCDLLPVGNDRFERTCTGFYFSGEYQLDFYAMDRFGNTSAPVRTAVTVTNPPTRKAIIVAAGNTSDANWPAIAKNAELAYYALKFQGYQSDNIYYLSPATSDAGVNGPATLSNLENALNTWAASNTHDVVLYLVGSGAPGNFRINADETLFAADLDAWLDELQGVIPGAVTVIYDASGSGSFLPILTPPAGKQRILITSASGNQSASFSAAGDISFSRFFWEQVYKGSNVWDAFLYARTAIEGGSLDQTPKLDDNGNGTPNEPTDGKIARDYTIGMGIKLSGNEPQSGEAMADLILNGGISADIWIDNVSATNTVEKVYAVITPPSSTPRVPGLPQPYQPTLDLTDNGTGRYIGTYNGFSTYGNYNIAIYVKDSGGNVSVPKQTTVFQAVGQDIFEEDDGPSQALSIVVNAPDAQRHNFHDLGDADWVMFYGLAGETYEFKTENIGANSHTKITLYGPDGTTVVATGKDETYVKGELRYLLQAPADGIYYVKVSQSDPAVFGPNTEYDLRVSHPVGGTAGTLVGRVIDYLGKGVSGAVLRAVGINTTAISLPNGYYMMPMPTGTYRITAEAAGYPPLTKGPVVIQTQSSTNLDFTVKEVNSAPVLNDIGNKVVDEGIKLSFTATATDADVPANTLTFTLDAGAPEGASITSSGLFSWTPTEAQGPGVYQVTIRVTDNGTPALTDSKTITITVKAKEAPKGDLNGDGKIDLADAVLVLKVISGVDTSGLILSDFTSSGAEVNGDNRVGMAEAIYILQKISGLR